MQYNMIRTNKHTPTFSVRFLILCIYHFFVFVISLFVFDLSQREGEMNTSVD